MQFRKPYDKAIDTPQKYDHRKIFVVQAGKKINVYDRIQANSVDTNIYDVLEKYNCQPTLMNAEKFCKTEIPSFYGDFKKMTELRDLHEQQIQAQNLWDQLPHDIRKEFNHDKLEFIERGQNWLENKIKAQQKPTTPTNENSQGVNGNEQK